MRGQTISNRCETAQHGMLLQVNLGTMSETAGDGVTPLCQALWPKAEAVILKEVRHMNIFPFYGQQWYGSPGVVDVWDTYLS